MQSLVWYNQGQEGWMRTSPITELLQSYYQAPRLLVRLERQRQGIERRIAYLDTQMDGARSLDDVTIPGTVSHYDGPQGHSNTVSNPTAAVVMRLQDRRLEELATLRHDLYEIERYVDELQRTVELLDDILSHLKADDRELLAARHRDGLTFETIAIRREETDESTPRRRCHEIEEMVSRQMWPTPLATLRRRAAESVPKPRRKVSETSLSGVLPYVRSSVAD